MRPLLKKTIIYLLLLSFVFGLTACGANPKEEKKRIGVLKGGTSEEAAYEYYPDSEIISYANFSECPEALESGEIDAYITDGHTARIVCRKYPSQAAVRSFSGNDFGFCFPLANTKLQNQMNEYLEKLKNTGALDRMQSIWLGDIEDLYQIDMSGLTGENGELKMAVSSDIGEPFVFVKDGAYMGYEIDIAVSFCREYGYSISFTDFEFADMLNEVSAGNFDIGASSVSITEDRKNRMLFSDPDYHSSIVLVEKKNDENSLILSINDLVGKNVGIQTSSSAIDVFNRYLPNNNLLYYESGEALAKALDNGEIDAYIADEPIAHMYNFEYPSQRQLTMLSTDAYSFVFPKNSNNGLFMRALFDEFLSEAKETGLLDELSGYWLNSSTEKQAVDYSKLPDINGRITMGVSSDSGAPFVYKINDEYYGYEIDLAARFCEKYGFALDVVNFRFPDLIDSVSEGKCDMGASCITMTAERAEKVLFSDATYNGGYVLTIKENSYGASDGKILSPNDLAGKKIGVQTGATIDQIAAKFLPDSPQEYYNSATDMAVALETGKIDAYAADEPIARLLCEEYDNHRILSMLTTESYAFVFPKKNAKSPKLQEEMSKFISDCKANGTLEEIDSIWFGHDESKQVVDFSDLSGENGNLTIAFSSTVGAPFIYVKDNQFVGYDMDIFHRFCKEYGYSATLTDYNISGMFSCLGSGKCDLAASCIAITEERKESMLFSEPDYEGGIVIVIKDVDSAQENASFFESISNSFFRTFLKEDRWKLFAGGIGTSAIIVLMSAIFGIILGVFFYYIYWRGNKVYCTAIDYFNGFCEKMPVVVILMIIYYIIFGKTNLSGVLISIIGFAILFAGSIVGLLKVGVGAVSPTQKEAAIALGYSENEALFHFILPQAAVHFLPGLKTALVSLIKETAIVGYIAVQDLTKVSDIVRSRTYEAFFPLIATALIYYAMAMILIYVVNKIEFRVTLKGRKISLLKGVKTR